MSPALARCRAEQAAIQARHDVQSGAAPAWLVTLGMLDWEIEAMLIAGWRPKLKERA